MVRRRITAVPLRFGQKPLVSLNAGNGNGYFNGECPGFTEPAHSRTFNGSARGILTNLPLSGGHRTEYSDCS